MGAGQKNLRILQETLEEIEKVAHQSSSDFSSIAKDFLTEAIIPPTWKRLMDRFS